jgi:hypothetical protein
VKGPSCLSAWAWRPVVGLAACVAAAPVLLAASPGGAAGPVPSALDTLPLAAPAASHSPDLAGYLLVKAPASATATARFKVPAVTCPTTVAESILVVAVAIAGSTTTKPDSTVGEVDEVCLGTSLTITAYLGAAEQSVPTSFTPAAGDEILVKATQSATASSVTLNDLTQKRSKRVSGGGSTNTEVFEGDSAGLSTAGGAAYPVPTFATDPFAAGRIDGVTVHASGATAVNMVSTGGVPQIKTGALSKVGGAWTETFEHN